MNQDGAVDQRPRYGGRDRYLRGAASTLEADVRALEGDKKDQSAKVGQLLAERAKAAGIETIVFDRGGNKYHGRIASLADAAREGGLEF